MKRFHYYLFDNYEPAAFRDPASDPRRILTPDIDGVVSAVVESPPGACRYKTLCETHGISLIDTLMTIGLLRREGDAVMLCSTVITAGDIPALAAYFAAPASAMADRLMENKPAIDAILRGIDNGYPPDVNLYHVLCAHILDGAFFDFLSANGVVATSRIHSTKQNYLITVYENAPETDAFSRKLLCSYNRYTDGCCALQSFGDADGNRVDFFRFSTQRAQDAVPEALREIQPLWDELGCTCAPQALFSAARQLAETGRCGAMFENLFTLFHYMRDGRCCVPVYRPSHQHAVEALERLTGTLLGDMAADALADAIDQTDLLCARHGVAAGEIKNELYHILFGLINEALIARGLAADPPYRPGEGRYLQSIALL